MANLPAQSCPRYRRHGPVRCPDHWLRPALRAHHSEIGSQRAGLIGVTTHPTAEWVARQITEAFPWNEAPCYMIRDRDSIYGAVVKRRLRAMGIRDRPLHRPRLGRMVSPSG